MNYVKALRVYFENKYEKIDKKVFIFCLWSDVKRDNGKYADSMSYV
jgi:hypothetical protein